MRLGKAAKLTAGGDANGPGTIHGRSNALGRVLRDGILACVVGFASSGIHLAAS